MIIITGASKGIGRFLLTTFKKLGLSVIGTYNSTNAFVENENENYYKVNIADAGEVKNWINSIADIDDFSNLVLINCAGINYNSFAHKSDLQKWHEVISVNLGGTFNVIHTILPHMREQNFGRIINISSVVTKLPTMGVSAYAASKSAINGLTKSLSVENASKGITVNSINLGYVNLGMGVEAVPEQYQEKMKAQIPLGRFCEPNEVFNTIDYIIKTEYVNGASIDINGGVI